MFSLRRGSLQQSPPLFFLHPFPLLVRKTFFDARHSPPPLWGPVLSCRASSFLIRLFEEGVLSLSPFLLDLLIQVPFVWIPVRDGFFFWRVSLYSLLLLTFPHLPRELCCEDSPSSVMDLFQCSLFFFLNVHRAHRFPFPYAGLSPPGGS